MKLSPVKAAFHDTDIDTDPTRPTRLRTYVRHPRFPRDDVGVGVVECGPYVTIRRLYWAMGLKLQSPRDSVRPCAVVISTSHGRLTGRRVPPP